MARIELQLFDACEQNSYLSVSSILTRLGSDNSRKMFLTIPHPEHGDKTPIQVVLEKLMEDMVYAQTLGAIVEAIEDEDIQAEILETKVNKHMLLHQLLDKHLDKLVQQDKIELSHFDLFELDMTNDLSESYNTMRNKHLLYIISKAQSFDLVHHEYVQRYTRCHFSHHFMNIFMMIITSCYFLMMISATTDILVACYGVHQNGSLSTMAPDVNQRTQLTDTGWHLLHTHTQVKELLILGSLTLGPAMVLFIIELLQMYARGWNYWTVPSNYLDCLIPIFAISISPITFILIIDCSEDNPKIFATLILTIIWLFGAWKLALLPGLKPLSFDHFCGVHKHAELKTTVQKIKYISSRTFLKPIYIVYVAVNKLIRKTSIIFMMFFKILTSVALSMFLIFYLCLFFAIAFIILFGIQHTIPGYSNIGHAVMTILMGKLSIDYKEIYHGITDLSTKDYVAGYLVLLLMFLCLPITAFNLLIGMAISDVRKIQKTSELIVFQNQVDMILETNRMKKKFKHCCHCCSPCCRPKMNVESLE